MNQRRLIKPTVRRDAGFTLIEALVALLILSIGLVGLAGLQTLSMRNNYGAYQRSQAVLKAYDAMDRMRANRATALAGGYDRGYGDAVPTTTCDATCSAAQMAQSDEREWVTSLQRLPGGDGAIAITGDIVTVRVHWDDDRNPDTAMTEFRLDTQL
jgi:type IV pilus assembly protein PilV